MKRSFRGFHTVLLLTAALALPGAVHAAEGPAGRGRGEFSDERIDRRSLPFVDVDLLRFEDRLDAERAGPELVPYRVAQPVQVDYNSAEHGTWEALADGGSLWRLQVTSPGAVFLSFQLSDLALPPGAELRFYSVDRAQEAGPYTSALHNPERRFGSPALAGDSAVIELHVPAAAPLAPRLAVESVSHGYRDFNGFARVPYRHGGVPLEPAIAALGACEVDVSCPEGSGWQADKRAMARTYDGKYLCTGALINNARQDCRSYFLTAAHCVSRSQTAAGMVFYWNYENATCGGSDASTSQTSTGSALRATNSSSDVTLLELNSRPDPAYNVYYAGFDRSATPPPSAVTIHHPDGAAKKISFENDPVEDGGSFGGGWGDDHWRIVGWDVGTTEPGSSGCPLFNPSHQIIGSSTAAPPTARGVGTSSASSPTLGLRVFRPISIRTARA